MIGLLSGLLGSRIGRMLIWTIVAFIAIGYAIIIIYHRGRRDEKTAADVERSMATINMLTVEAVTNRELAALSTSERRMRLKAYADSINAM